MRFKFVPNRLRNQVNNIFNKNERLATNIVNPVPTSRFDMSFRHLTTFDSGKLVPVFCKEALPGDIFNIDVSTLLRLSTPAAATMENAIYDISFFFVPNRLVLDTWKYFMGENKSAGFQKEYKTLPLINYDVSLKYTANDLASYIGFPQNKDMSKIGVPVNSLYFKSYIKIWNDFYRDENVQSEIDNTNNNNNDSNVVVSNYKDKPYNESLQIGQGLAPVSRLTDYFSTCLPYPQKGDTVDINSLPLENLIIGNDIDKKNIFSPLWYDIKNNNLPVPDRRNLTSGLAPGSDANKTGYGLTGFVGVESEAGVALKLSVDGNAQAYNINDLRLAIAIQHIRELDARGGTRYTEILLNHFGVMSSDARLQRAEYIGGFRDNININNVVQSSSSTTSSPLGVLGGVSVSAGQTPRSINYACEEHGIIYGFVVVRPQVNYSQGLDKQFTRVEKLDYYEPLLAHIGEQPVYKYELYLDDSNSSNTNNEIFGYNEAWADYRYSLNKMSGYMSVNNDLSLASLYSYTEKYSSAPVLGADWMEAKSSIIGDTLILNSDKLEYVHQFLGDFYFNLKTDRRMPVYSVPGIYKI